MQLGAQITKELLLNFHAGSTAETPQTAPGEPMDLVGRNIKDREQKAEKAN